MPCWCPASQGPLVSVDGVPSSDMVPCCSHGGGGESDSLQCSCQWFRGHLSLLAQPHTGGIFSIQEWAAVSIRQTSRDAKPMNAIMSTVSLKPGTPGTPQLELPELPAPAQCCGLCSGVLGLCLQRKATAREPQGWPWPLGSELRGNQSSVHQMLLQRS